MTMPIVNDDDDEDKNDPIMMMIVMLMKMIIMLMMIMVIIKITSKPACDIMFHKSSSIHYQTRHA